MSNEESEMWKAYREEKQKKRLKNKDFSTNLLRAHGIEFESMNDGIHLKIKTKKGIIDFWPSTGKWTTLNHEYKRGIYNLLKYIKKIDNILKFIERIDNGK